MEPSCVTAVLVIYDERTKQWKGSDTEQGIKKEARVCKWLNVGIVKTGLSKGARVSLAQKAARGI